MNTTVNDNLTKEQIDFLKKCYFSGFDNSEMQDYLEDSIKKEKVFSIAEIYITLTNPELKGPALLEYREKLQKDFIKYIRTNDIKDVDDNIIENMAKISFLRLVKASKDYYLKKNYHSKSDNFKELKKIAERFSKDYKLIMSIN